MPRPRSQKTADVKAKLLARLREGRHRPGDRFLSNRAIATRYGISYQTAHRLVSELAEEGHLLRRSASGTYVPGRRPTCDGVQLLFHPRAARPGSFGQRLLSELRAGLEHERLKHEVVMFDAKRLPMAPGQFPVIWECPQALAHCVTEHRPTLLLNDRPPSGIASVYVDSVSTDDFSGGACAAQLLMQRVKVKKRSGHGRRFAVLSGPADDHRSSARVAGFLSVLDAEVVAADGWYLEDGADVAARTLSLGTSGIFCCNDRLAEAVIEYAAQKNVVKPALIGFDDAPVAEQLNLTTIAIPWEELAAGAVSVIKRRLAGDPSTASQQIFAPRPVTRG